MTLRAACLSPFIACLMSLPVTASQPAGLAGKMITDVGDANFDPNGLDYCSVPRDFEWHEYFGSRQLDPNDVVTLEMAIMPFGSGGTVVTLIASDVATFFGIAFSDGLVEGLPYDRAGWNDVTVKLRPATQDYTLMVNGLPGGPFPFTTSCQDQGGCFTVQELRIDGYSNEVGSVAWIDTISISRETAVGRQIFRQRNFDSCSQPQRRPPVIGGVVLVTEPPERLISPRCAGRGRQ
jgi:hypothetical protein